MNTSSEWVDPDDAPELDKEWFAKATVKEAGKPRVGRPPGSDKERISLRLDKDIVERYRATGSGWQTRMNDALRRSLRRVG